MGKRFDPPSRVGRTNVEASDAPHLIQINGEEWVTLRPVDEADDRLWEFSLTSGRLIQTFP